VPWINAEKYGVPVSWALTTDPQKTVYRGDNPSLPVPNGASVGKYHVPNSATPDPGTDRHLVVFDPGGLYSSEMWLAYNNLTWVNVGGFSRHDLKNGSGFTPLSLTRTWELQAGSVRHALAMSLPQVHMAKRFVPPASSIDNYNVNYAGTVPMGQLVALAPDVDVTALGLTTPAGRALARALQAYGAYVVETGGALALYAEPGAQSHVTATRNKDATGVSDVMRIVRQLRCVTNNAGPAWGGGGTPLAPPAPAFG
jgi:hypothetical protein